MASIKKISILTLSLVAIVGLIYFRPQIAGYFAAPKFKSLHYSYTERIASSMCIFVCTYTDTYWYEAKGVQKELAQNVIDVMAKNGFRLRHQDGVMCYGASGDDYIFEKDNQLVGVHFYAKSQLPDVNTSAIGCDRPYADYKVSIDH